MPASGKRSKAPHEIGAARVPACAGTTRRKEQSPHGKSLPLPRLEVAGEAEAEHVGAVLAVDAPADGAAQQAWRGEPGAAARGVVAAAGGEPRLAVAGCS